MSDITPTPSPITPPSSDLPNTQTVTPPSTITPSPLAPPPQSQPPESPKPFYLKMPKWLVVTIIAVLVLLLAIGVWWIYDMQAKKLTSSTVLEEERRAGFPELTIPSTEQSSIDSTTNWKSYISQKCGYQIKYPPTWYIFTDAEKEDGGIILISSHQVQKENVSQNELRLQIVCSDIDPNTSIEDIVNNLNSRYEDQNVTIQQSQQLLISSKTAFGQIVSFSASNLIQEYYIFLTNSRVLILNFTPADSDYTGIISPMLSSLTWR